MAFQETFGYLVMEVPQGLEIASARRMNPRNCVRGFYCNLPQFYKDNLYNPSHIWNVDESGCNASRSGLEKVLVKKGIMAVHIKILNEREWLSVLTSINATGRTSLTSSSSKGKED